MIQLQASSAQDRTLHKWVDMESHNEKSVKNQPKTFNDEVNRSNLTVTAHLLIDCNYPRQSYKPL